MKESRTSKHSETTAKDAMHTLTGPREEKGQEGARGTLEARA